MNDLSKTTSQSVTQSSGDGVVKHGPTAKPQPLAKRHVPPFGTLSIDLYDEEMALAYRKRALRASAAMGATGALLVAAWMLACLPHADLLDIPQASWGLLDPRRVLAVYPFLRNRVPLILSVLAICPFFWSSHSIAQIRIDHLFGDLPTSATLFSAKDDSRPNAAAPRWTASAPFILFALGACAWLAASRGPLHGGALEWPAYVLCGVCAFVGIGLAVFHATYQSLTSRAFHIDEYDELLPESGSDGVYRARIYSDHVRGIAQLAGLSFSLGAVAALLGKIPGNSIVNVPAVTVNGEVFFLLPSYARAYWLFRALLGFSPLLLTIAAVITLAEAILRHHRFVIEWSVLDVPSYPESLADASRHQLRKSTILGVACIALGLCTWVFNWAVRENMLPLTEIETNEAVVVSSVLTLLVAGRMIARLVEHLLLGESAYRDAHAHFPLFDLCDDTFATLDILDKVREAGSMLACLCVFLSITVLIALLCNYPVASWQSVIYTLMDVFHIM